MDDADWNNLESGLRDKKTVDRFLAATQRMNKETTSEDLPRLMRLLEDGDYLIREAAAGPIVRLSGVPALPALLQAYQRGLDEGYDNDGFTNALIELAQANKKAARGVLTALRRAGDPSLEKNAEWLLEFVE